MAKIGLLSDSHGRTQTTLRAVDLLLEQGIDVLLHLGDVGGVEVVDALAVEGVTDRPVESRLVFGNTDWDIPAMSKYAQTLGILVDHPTGRLEVDGKRLAFCHGHIEADLDAALRDGVDYLCHGHTHRFTNELHGSTRVINPGALFRASRYTVAVLDTGSGEVAVHELPPAG
ncbi:MAG: metallophosphoesterase family protein [Planctomycetota bacterium]